MQERQTTAAFIESCLAGGPAEDSRRESLGASTSFACEKVVVQTAAGSRALFLKDYGDCRLPRDDEETGAREVEVYRWILADAELGTPTFLGSDHSGFARGGRLLLEYVDSRALDEAGEDDWLEAAGWLGRLQSLDIDAISPANVRLIEHDANYFLSTAHGAVAATRSIDPAHERKLQEHLEGYEILAHELDLLPRVLVHGSFRPQNLLIRTLPITRGQGAIVPVDWEHTARGSALYDVAFLSANLGRRRTAQILEAHRHAALEHGVPLPPAIEADRLVTVIQLHKVLRSLTRATSWGYAQATVEKLVVQAGDLANRIRLHRSGPSPIRAHPAVRAWRELGNRGPDPNRIDGLRGRYFGRRKRVVYRLDGLGPAGSATVCKRCRTERGRFEHRVYEELLPRLGVTHPRAFGWVETGEFGWLFLEDAGRTAIDLDDPDQLAQAEAWLAGFHAAGRAIERPSWLPDRGLEAHRGLLSESRERVVRALGSGAFDASVRASLKRIASTIERVLSSWTAIAELCGRATLVHGDFRRKNLCVRPLVSHASGAGVELLPIDWEYAGWGVPEVDRGALLARKANDVRMEGRSGSDLAAIALRSASGTSWSVTHLDYPFPERGLSHLDVHMQRLERVLDELGVER